MPTIQPPAAGNPAGAAPAPARTAGQSDAAADPFDAALREAGATPAAGARTSAKAPGSDKPDGAPAQDKADIASGAAPAQDKADIATRAGPGLDATEAPAGPDGTGVAVSNAQPEPRPLNMEVAGLAAQTGRQVAPANGGESASKPDAGKPVAAAQPAPGGRSEPASPPTGQTAAQATKDGAAAQTNTAPAQTSDRKDGAPPAQPAAAQAQTGKAQGEAAAAQSGKTQAEAAPAQTARTQTGPASPQTAGAKPDAAVQAGQEGEAEAAMQTLAASRDGRGRAEQSVAERAAGAQTRSELRTGKGDAVKAGGETQADNRPAAAQLAPAPAGSAAAARPLAELIAFQMQQASAGAPILIEGATGIETAASADGELGLDTGQMRAEARGEALRTPAQAGQPARFTPHTVQHLAARIAQTAAGGGRTVDIRLDPPELGRVQVRLEMGADNSVRALLSAERVDTLAELQRTARDLEKALADAGLDLAENGLEFSLSQDGDDTFEPGGRFTPVFAESEATSEPAAGASPSAAPALYGFALSQRIRLDVRI